MPAVVDAAHVAHGRKANRIENEENLIYRIIVVVVGAHDQAKFPQLYVLPNYRRRADSHLHPYTPCVCVHGLEFGYRKTNSRRFRIQHPALNSAQHTHNAQK